MQNKLNYKDLLLIYAQWWRKRIYLPIISLIIFGLSELLLQDYFKDLHLLDPNNAQAVVDPNRAKSIILFSIIYSFVYLAGIILFLIFDKRYLYQALIKSYPCFSIHSQKQRLSWSLYFVITNIPAILTILINYYTGLFDLNELGEPTIWLMRYGVTMLLGVSFELLISLPLLGWILQKSKKFMITRHNSEPIICDHSTDKNN
ncbi:hypothetical protein [Candidatus Odyssella thessalonicensis]|uniref:hypothetical protein n=1 Tax=Candidatus Odyssella thessalonicensis TaxID=84647 RepID=UPI000225A9E9|nr:hypothetical protein [Candidatus Odyssella thessalonicensis]